MASVLIIDDNRATSAYLKMFLMRERHHVRRGQDVRKALFPRFGAVPDLVLINQAMNNPTGWELFNHLKRLAPTLPAMVYVMESNGIKSAGWICRAVEAAVGETKAPPSPAPSTPTFGSEIVALVAKKIRRFQWET
jgi:DNA-binding NtrC family response regulator